MSKIEKDRDPDVHSEKVCKLLAEIPSQLEKCGWIIIIAIILVLLLVVCFMPYPHSAGCN